MKTQILQLEPHDDVISVRDKMGWGQAARIVLVWPAHEPILTRRLDLVLLQRHSASVGAQLALVTGDTDVRFHARELKLPVFKTLRQAQYSTWRVGRRRPRRLQRPAPRPDIQALREEAHPSEPAWFETSATRRGFYGLALAAFLIVCAVFLPGAEIHLAPRTQEQEITLIAVADTSIQTPNLSGDLPARTRSVVVEGREAITTTRIVTVPEKTASGRVMFTNLTGQAVSVPAGSIVSALDASGAETLRFSTHRAGLVPAGVGQTLRLPVQALSPGSSGNLPADSIRAIQGPLGLSLAVTNPDATRGGTDRSAPGPSLADYTALHERLLASLEESALAELEASLPRGSFPITPTLTLSQTLEEIYDPLLPAEGQPVAPSGQLTLKMRLEFELLVVSPDDLDAISAGILDANLPPGFTALPQSIAIQHLTRPIEDEAGAYRWRMQVSRKIQARITKEQVRQLAHWRSAGQAAQILADHLPLAALPSISMTPSWWPRMPVLPLRISVAWD